MSENSPQYPITLAQIVDLYPKIMANVLSAVNFPLPDDIKAVICRDIVLLDDMSKLLKDKLDDYIFSTNSPV